ncbi:GGDEF domain-containing response regulator [Thalassotalea hakodatensis]|uniref:GGDEF domain-containing response regulator n=1 Tax=Thalassotalea hakodatensis TaxID=3030492 RepID=UPI002573013B|nr:GGDEF domain-containing response regulator [Thalassotalea hakodatensis]
MNRIVVAILEDCSEDQYLIKQKLSEVETQTFNVQCFSSIESLANSINLLEPDVLITDLNLPESQGLDTLIKIKAFAKKTPIIVLTGSDEDIAIKAIQLGAQDFLKKEELSSTLITRTILFARERFLFQSALEEQAIRDKLTQLYNREAFEAQVEKKYEEYIRYQSKFALVLIDLDNFKPINDEFGHLVGDRILQLLADRLRMFNRVSDTVARIGGDEFVILAPHINNHQDLALFIEAKKQKLCGVYALASSTEKLLELNITMSFGGAVMGIDGEDTQTIFEKADAAMYVAKRENK